MVMVQRAQFWTVTSKDIGTNCQSKTNRLAEALLGYDADNLG